MFTAMVNSRHLSPAAAFLLNYFVHLSSVQFSAGKNLQTLQTFTYKNHSSSNLFNTKTYMNSKTLSALSISSGNMVTMATKVSKKPTQHSYISNWSARNHLGSVFNSTQVSSNVHRERRRAVKAISPSSSSSSLASGHHHHKSHKSKSSKYQKSSKDPNANINYRELFITEKDKEREKVNRKAKAKAKYKAKFKRGFTGKAIGFGILTGTMMGVGASGSSLMTSGSNEYLGSFTPGKYSQFQVKRYNHKLNLYQPHRTSSWYYHESHNHYHDHHGHYLGVTGVYYHHNGSSFAHDSRDHLPLDTVNQVINDYLTTWNLSPEGNTNRNEPSKLQSVQQKVNNPSGQPSNGRNFVGPQFRFYPFNESHALWEFSTTSVTVVIYTSGASNLIINYGQSFLLLMALLQTLKSNLMLDIAALVLLFCRNLRLFNCFQKLGCNLQVSCLSKKT